MSGIYGIFYKNHSPVSFEDIEACKKQMSDWGPDGQNEWYDDCLVLGHMMLHTTPESQQEQLPLYCENRRLAITADARIDNRLELLDIFQVEKDQFITDSAIILMAYEKWGKDCVLHLVGAFSFVIWDSRNKLLFCARDHMGLRPFYYYEDEKRFIFASDIEGILSFSNISNTLNDTLIAIALQESSYFAEKRYTFFRDIVKIPPACFLQVSENASTLERYWSLKNIKPVRFSSREDYIEHLRELLWESVRCRVRSNFMTGTHLSGGLDSSMIAVMASRLLRERDQSLTGYSWSPPPNESSLGTEHKWIKAVCQQEGIECNYINLTVEDTLQHYQIDFACRPSEMMLREELLQQKFIANGTRIVLSGWGGDEVLTSHGWGFWSQLFLQGRWSRLHREIWEYTKLVAPNPRLRNYLSVANGKILKPLLPNKLLEIWYILNGKRMLSCINRNFSKKHYDEVGRLRGPWLREKPGVQGMQWRWLENGHLTKRIEAWAINGAKRHLNYCYPLLDRRILEFCLGIPFDLFVHDGWKRTLPRQASRNILPETLLNNRSKVESAAFKVIGNVLDQALPRLYEQIDIERDERIISKYVDIEKMKCLVHQNNHSGQTEHLLNTLACLNVITKHENSLNE